MKRTALAAPAIVAIALAATIGCRPKNPEKPPGPQTSASVDDARVDELVARGRTPEERATLAEAKADADAEARRTVAAQDAEIARLERENEALRQQLAR